MGKQGGKKKKRQGQQAHKSTLSKSTSPVAGTGEATEHDSDADLVAMVTALNALPLIHFETILTEMLYPNGIAKDAEQWRGNHALLEALRSMYLRKSFGETDTYKLVVEKASKAHFLPTRSELIDMFLLKRPSVENWKRASSTDHLQRQTALCSNPDSSVSEWTLEDKLEAIGCAVWGRNAFNLCCEDTGRYEFLTQDYIDELATYIEGRILASGKPFKLGALIEVGAGSGALTYFINEALKKRKCVVECIATDPDFRPAPRQRVGITAQDHVYPVKALGYEEALLQFKPTIVLCAWMPMGQDWTATMRATSSVSEIILVGEADFGACGNNELTWGSSDDQTKKPRYVEDGWERLDLDSLSRLQMQRYDSDFYSGNSITVSFRRKSNEAAPALSIFD